MMHPDEILDMECILYHMLCEMIFQIISTSKNISMYVNLTGVVDVQFSGECLQHTFSLCVGISRQFPQTHHGTSAFWGSLGGVEGFGFRMSNSIPGTFITTSFKTSFSRSSLSLLIEF